MSLILKLNNKLNFETSIANAGIRMFKAPVHNCKGLLILRGGVIYLLDVRSTILYLFCGEGSHLLSRMCPALGGCRLTMLFGEESSGPKSCVGFFYKKHKKKKKKHS